jgi:histidine triad (HIT) family protein
VRGEGDEGAISFSTDVVFQNEEVMAFVSSHQWPNNPGNVIIVPKKHYESIYDLPVELAARVQELAKAVALAMKAVWACDGVSTRQHNEPAGNQDVWHYHLHVTPRYAGDEFYTGYTSQRALMPGDERARYAMDLKERLRAGTVRPRSSSDSYLGQLRLKVGHALVKVPGGRIVLEDTEERVLLQKRSDFGLWGLPAGSPELTETASESIRREVLEETGLRVLDLECFGYSSNPEFEIITYPSEDVVHTYCLLFCSRRWQGELIESSEETLALAFFSLAELPEMIANHRRTLSMFAEYKHTGRFQLD